MSKYFVVVKNNDEYNDEVYTIQDGGTPVKVALTQEVAQKYADELNWKQFSGLEVYYYTYDLSDILRSRGGEEELSELLEKVFPDHTFDLDELVLPEMTLEQYKQIAPYFDLNFYSIKAVDS